MSRNNVQIPLWNDGRRFPTIPVEKYRVLGVKFEEHFATFHPQQARVSGQTMWFLTHFPHLPWAIVSCICIVVHRRPDYLLLFLYILERFPFKTIVTHASYNCSFVYVSNVLCVISMCECVLISFFIVVFKWCFIDGFFLICGIN